MFLELKKIREVILNPFPYFTQDNIFPASFYEALNKDFEQFTQDEDFKSNRINNRCSINSDSRTFTTLINKSKSWKALIDQIKTQQFINEIRLLLSECFLCRPLQLDKRWVLFEENRNRLLSKRDNIISIKTKMFLVESKTGYSLLPHTDNPKKIASLLFYFPSDNWKDESIGGTSFFTHKYDLDHHEKGVVAPFNDCCEFYRSPYKPNSITGFMKTGNSFHGVKKLNCLPDMSRKIFIVVIEIDNYLSMGQHENISFLSRLGSIVGSVTQPCKKAGLPCDKVYKNYRKYIEQLNE